jgi:peroxiredoxin
MIAGKLCVILITNILLITLSTMSLNIGEKVPSFEIEDVNGQKVEIEEGKKYIISFHRYMGCVWCQMDIIKLLKEKDKLKEKGVEVIIFIQSPEEVVKEYLKDFPDFPFRLVPDPEKKVYKIFGVESGSFFDIISPTALLRTLKDSPTLAKKYKFVKGGIKGDKYLRPAFFVVDNGVIIWSYKSKNVADSPDISEMLSKVGAN